MVKKWLNSFVFVKKLLTLPELIRIIAAILSGAVVQLVRIPACHAGGRGFESRPLRQMHKPVYIQAFFIFKYPLISRRNVDPNAGSSRYFFKFTFQPQVNLFLSVTTVIRN